jgi:propanol-preferring alcohol dehydrogenase
VKAVRLHPGPELRVDEVPDPTPGPGEVRVAVRAAGLCGTDFPVPNLPVVMGHEGAGVIDALGEGVETLEVGTRVLLLPGETCGSCGPCRRGQLGLCRRARILGLMRDGTFAELISLPVSCLVPLPDAVPFEQGAILADAVATAYHAVSTRADLKPGDRVAVVGCGGLGFHAILVARLLGAERIVAVDASEGSLRRAQEAGADAAVDARREDARRAIREAAGEDGPTVAVEFVGRVESVALAMACVARGGRVVLGGIGLEPPELPPLVSFIGRELAVLGSMGYTLEELNRVVQLAAAGELDLSRSITARYPLERAAEAFDDLHERRGDPVRLALVPTRT